MRFLITGGAGFIGSHLVERLAADGHAVTALDDLSTGRRENVSCLEAAETFRFVEGSILDTDLIEALVEGAPTRSSTSRPRSASGSSWNSRRARSSRMSAALRRCALKRRTPTLVASTSEVYGKATKFPFSENDDLKSHSQTRSSAK